MKSINNNFELPDNESRINFNKFQENVKKYLIMFFGVDDVNQIQTFNIPIFEIIVSDEYKKLKNDIIESISKLDKKSANKASEFCKTTFKKILTKTVGGNAFGLKFSSDIYFPVNNRVASCRTETKLTNGNAAHNRHGL